MSVANLPDRSVHSTSKQTILMREANMRVTFFSPYLAENETMPCRQSLAGGQERKVVRDSTMRSVV